MKKFTILIVTACLFWACVSVPSKVQVTEQKTETKKSTRLIAAMEVIDSADFTTNDKNFRSGSTNKVFIEDYIYLFFTKGRDDRDVRMFYSQIMKPENTNLHMCVYDEEYEFIAQVTENSNAAKDDHDIIIYCADNSEHTIRKIGTVDFNDFTVKVYGTENQIIATMWRCAGTPKYYVEFKTDKIRRETILAVIPMVMEIEKR
ncbi:MAG: hypothetical protein JSW41_02540 [Candidatus Aenigmatarchaeota archaeon]|nr:MAG: hypothetical protein JSW41_02540 [Candidatus Aenigmarchaeota archaeon]